jgi:hypothetical protein
MVGETENIPAAVSRGSHEQFNVEALQYIFVFKLCVGGSDGCLEHPRQVVKKELTGRPFQLVPAK